MEALNQKREQQTLQDLQSMAQKDGQAEKQEGGENAKREVLGSQMIDSLKRRSVERRKSLAPGLAALAKGQSRMDSDEVSK